MRSHLPILVCLAMLLAAACGGGGGSPPTAPTISALSLTPRALYPSAAPVAFFATFDFADPNGDLDSATVTVTDSNGVEVLRQTTDVPLPGVTASQLQGTASAVMANLGVFTLRLFATDATGLRSNELTDTIAVTPYPWVELAPPPLRLRNAAAVGLGGAVYAIGGTRVDAGLPGGEATSDVVGAFEPVSNTWTARASLSTPRTGIAAAAFGGRIYTIGGYRRDPIATWFATVEEYDPVADAWTPKVPMPTPRAHAAVAVFDGKIVVIGGEDQRGPGAPLSTIEAYDPVANSWTTLPSLPRGRTQAGAAVLGGRLCVAGGTGAQPLCLQMLDAFDAANGWVTPFNWPGCCNGLVTIDDRLVTLAGTFMQANVDPDDIQWHELTPALLQTDGTSAIALLDGRLYVLSEFALQRYSPALEIH